METRAFAIFLTSADVAKRLQVVPDRVRQLTRSGRLKPAGVTESGVRLYTVEDVERYLREREQTQQATSHVLDEFDHEVAS
jgi:DNA-binding transcriptional MerR regulator